mgnify:CR=1 FL=1
MPETRYNQVFDSQGNPIESIPFEVSDEQLYQEQLAKEMNAAHEQAILAFKNWGSLTLVQKDTILKNMVKWALCKDGWLKLGVL